MVAFALEAAVLLVSAAIYRRYARSTAAVWLSAIVLVGICTIVDDKPTALRFDGNEHSQKSL